MYDVVSLGELLIDFTMVKDTDTTEGMFQRNPGGAPANVLAALAKLGKHTAFIGKVGQDSFGHFLQDVLVTNGIDARGLVFTEKENTTLAFVELDNNGERSFTFYRKPGADLMLTKDELNMDLVRNSRIFHFGSISLTHQPVHSATIEAVQNAKEAGAVISYDPNIRLGLWSNESQARETILESLHHADIVKISEEEMMFLFHTSNLETGTEHMWQRYGNKLILVTLGANGCFYRFGKSCGSIEGFQVNTVDTTGAGDAFLGGVLYQLLEKTTQLDQLTLADIEGMVRFGNAMGALVTTRRGAIPAMPILDEVNEKLVS